MTSDNLPKNSVKKILGYIIPFLLAGIFIYISFRNVSFNNLMDIISNTSILWFVVFIVMFYLSHLARALRWNVMLSSVKKTSLSNSFSAVMIGYGINCAVPRLGEVYRAFFMGRWEDLSRTQMLGSVIVERVLDVLVLAISVFASILLYDGDLLEQIPWLSDALWIVSIFVLVGISFLIFLVFFRSVVKKILLKVFSGLSERVAGKIEYMFDMLADGFSTIKDSRTIWVTIFLSALIMIIYGVNSYFGMLMLRFDEVQPINVGMGWIIMTISAFGIVLPTPGGTGSYHIITKLALVTLYGFSEDVGMAYALLTHGIGLVLFVATTIFVMIWANYRMKKQGKDQISFFNVFKNKTAES